MRCVLALFFCGSFVNFGPDNGVMETEKNRRIRRRRRRKGEGKGGEPSSLSLLSSPSLSQGFSLPRFFVVLLKEKRTHFTFPWKLILAPLSSFLLGKGREEKLLQKPLSIFQKKTMMGGGGDAKLSILEKRNLRIFFSFFLPIGANGTRFCTFFGSCFQGGIFFVSPNFAYVKEEEEEED